MGARDDAAVGVAQHGREPGEPADADLEPETWSFAAIRSAAIRTVKRTGRSVGASRQPCRADAGGRIVFAGDGAVHA